MITNEIISKLSEKQMNYFELVEKDYVGVQRNLLKKIVSDNENSIYGKDHNFSNISSIDDYRNAVPTNYYNDLIDYIDKCKTTNSVLTEDPICYWGKTSGTSGKAKLIPHTKESLSNWNLGMLRNIFSFVYNKKDKFNFEGGKFAYLLASPKLGNINNVPVGYISGIAKLSNNFLNDFTSVPDEVMNMTDFDAKLFETAKYIIKENIVGIGSITSFSIWLLNYVKKYAAPKLLDIPEYRNIIEPTLDVDGNVDLSKLWPNMQIFLSTGVLLDDFKTKLYKLIKKPWLANFYAGTEGAYAFTCNPEDKGMTLNADLYFFEFKDIKNNNIYLLQEVKLNREYEVIITGTNGLYRYYNGDIIEFVNLNPYQIKVLGRKSTVINLAGEKLNEKDISEALNYSLEKMNLSCEIYFFFGWSDDDGFVHHCLAIELNNHINKNEINCFMNIFTEKLKSIKITYKGGFGSIIKSPHYIVLKNGTFSKLEREKSNKVGNVGHSKLKKILSLDEARDTISPDLVLENNLPDEIKSLFKNNNSKMYKFKNNNIAS